METKIATLEVRVENIEAWAEKHERDDDRTHKYINNMLEDLLEKLVGLERSAARFESDLAHRNGNDLNTHSSLKEIYERIRVLERLVWIAVGGVIVTGGIVSIVGGNILKILSR